MEIKDRITKKSGELFLNHGVKNISMDEIASSLGISKRTIYENFKDKEELLVGCLQMFAGQQREAFNDAEKESDNVIETFLKMGESSKVTSKIPNVKFFEDIEKYYPSAKQFIENSREKKFEAMKRFLTRGISEGVIRDNLNVDVAAFIVHDTHSYIFMRALQFNSHPFSFEALFYTMIINFIRGISTEKGIRIIDAHLKNEPFKFKKR